MTSLLSERSQARITTRYIFFYFFLSIDVIGYSSYLSEKPRNFEIVASLSSIVAAFYLGSNQLTT